VSVTYSTVYDLAVIRGPDMPSGIQGIPICDSKKSPMGYDTLFYFLGFPFGLSVETEFGTSLFNLPLVKRAWLAGSVPIDNKSHRLMVLDAINNYGFSGGPIVLTSPGLAPFSVCLVGVTIGFLPRSEQVVVSGKKIEASVPYNTGLMFGVPAIGIREVLEASQKPPKN
jgi:hypothetical protein